MPSAMSSTFYRFLEAVRVGTTEEVGAMLDLEPTLINRYDASRRSALVWAAHRRGRLEVMRLLLSRKSAHRHWFSMVARCVSENL